MTTPSSLKKTFNEALAADHSAHKTIVQTVVGDTKTLGNEFDTIWPKAEPVLAAVTNFIRFIPGLGTAAPVITALIAVGNALYQAEQPSSKTTPT
ncbi:MAG: hypothetical protein AAGB11_10790 [Pseudomonadota bacterium]